jgi:hypothetical protein
MNSTLQPQLKDHKELKRILRKVEVTIPLSDGREVDTLLVYFPITSGTSCHKEFLDKIKESLLYNFVFSCEEIEKKLNVSSSESANKLFEKAVRKISQKTAHGELGELIIFTLLDVYFKAPKLLSKVSLKSNSRMPVFGADAVHGQFVDGSFKLYLGESKLYTKFKAAVPEAVKSIKNAMQKYDEEFDLIDSYIDFPGINEDLEKNLLELLDPFSESDVSKTIHSPCFIGFAEPEMISSVTSDSDFIEKYICLATDYIENFFEKLEGQGVDVKEVSLFLLPYSSVDNMVRDFVEHVGIKK